MYQTSIKWLIRILYKPATQTRSNYKFVGMISVTNQDLLVTEAPK